MTGKADHVTSEWRTPCPVAIRALKRKRDERMETLGVLVCLRPGGGQEGLCGRLSFKRDLNETRRPQRQPGKERPKLRIQRGPVPVGVNGQRPGGSGGGEHAGPCGYQGDFGFCSECDRGTGEELGVE